MVKKFLQEIRDVSLFLFWVGVLSKQDAKDLKQKRRGIKG